MAGDLQSSKRIPIPEETKFFMSPDHTKTTRLDYTNFFLRFDAAPDAHLVYENLFLVHQLLAKLLMEHPAMAPNLQQTFSTPANSKNKIYFMWDFVLRTFQILVAKVSPQTPFKSPMIMEVIGRAAQAKNLILDTTGQLEAGNKSFGYNDDAGVEFTDEIKELAVKLGQRLPGCAGCAGCGNEKQEDGKALLLCGKCKRVNYCSVNCQKACWKMHRLECRE